MLRRIGAALLLRAAEHFDEEVSRDELERWVMQSGADASGLGGEAGPVCDPSQARLWVDRVSERAKMPKEPFPPGLGLALDALGDDGECAAAIEHVLRHVEVLRADCLPAWAEVTAAADRDFERLGMAILFARTTARTDDLRFLNAGLKMIDWFGSGFIRASRREPGRLRARVLQAARECLACLDEVERP